jgi:tetratricopeptide (TPR) repeat protein
MVCVQLSVLGFVYAEIGEFARAEPVLREAVAGADRMGLSVIGAVARQNLGYVLAATEGESVGRLEDARRFVERAAESFAALRNGRLAGGARAYLARIALLAGDAARAAREATGALELLAEAPTLRPMALAELARALLAQGRTTEAMERASEAAELVRSLGAVEEGEALVALVYAEALGAAGRMDEAHSAIRAARDRLLERARKISREAWREGFLSRVAIHAETLRLWERWCPQDAVSAQGS